MPFPAYATLACAIALVVGAAAVVPRLRGAPVGFAAIAGAFAVVWINAQFYTRHYSDDAYITLRYSRNLAGGAGPVWNPGERVEGYTDFLWMALLAALHRLGADLQDASIWLAYASMLVLFVVVWRIWALWAREESGVLASGLVPAVALFLIATNDSIVFWGFSGLETMLAAALLTGTVYLYMRESRSQTRRGDGAVLPLSALAASAAAMTRPEMILVAAVTGLFTARDAIERRDDGATVRLALLWALLFGATYGAYFIWRYAYYGHLFPNTYYAKVGSDLDFINRGIGYVNSYVLSYYLLPFVAGAAMLLFASARTLQRDAQYVLAVIAAWMLAVIVEGGDAFFHGRFIAPVVPLMYIAGASGLALALGRAIAQPRHVAAIALPAALVISFSLMRGSIDGGLETDRRARDEREVLGRWLHDHVPPDDVVAVYTAGAVPYFARTRALDMFGLTDETIAHTDVPDFGTGIPGHEKYNIDYVLATARPAMISLGDSSPFVATAERLKADPGALPAQRALIGDPRTFELYEPAAVEHDGRWFNLLVRKDALGHAQFDWTEGGGFVGR